jgi:pilus assembly protein CpaE
MKLSAMIFASVGDMGSRIQRRCINCGDMTLFRSPEYRPSAADMVLQINSYNPELVLIEFHDPEDALAIETMVRTACPSVAILGFADQWPTDRLIKCMGGCLQIIPTTISQADFTKQVAETMDEMHKGRTDDITVFLPAKAGSGASTVALNVCGALANKCGKSTILIEADLHSGPAGMYLNLDPKHSVVDALQESHRLESVWDDVVTPVQNFAILPAFGVRGGIPQASPWDYRRLLMFTRLRYEHVIFDLPEVVNAATEAIVSNAKTIYVVCTPEVPSLMLARKRCAGLMERGVSADCLKIVLNRYSKDGPDPAAVGEILGYPVSQVIPNDYKSLWDANLKRSLVSDQSAVGRACEAFACSLAGQPVVSAAKPARKFLGGLFSAA